MNNGEVHELVTRARVIKHLADEIDALLFGIFGYHERDPERIRKLDRAETLMKNICDIT